MSTSTLALVFALVRVNEHQVKRFGGKASSRVCQEQARPRSRGVTRGLASMPGHLEPRASGMNQSRARQGVAFSQPFSMVAAPYPVNMPISRIRRGCFIVESVFRNCASRGTVLISGPWANMVRFTIHSWLQIVDAQSSPEERTSPRLRYRWFRGSTAPCHIQSCLLPARDLASSSSRSSAQLRLPFCF